MMKWTVALFVAALVFCAPHGGQAQTGSLIIDQNRADRVAPPVTPAPPPPPGAGTVEAAPAASTAFRLSAVDIQGSSLSGGDLRTAYADYLGRTVTASELSALAEAVGRVYAKSDIALYTVLLPRQDFADGRVRIRVVEGYISEVEIRPGKIGQKTGLIEHYAAKLRAESPLRRSTLERYISLMRDIPGSKLDVQLLPGGSPGAVKMIVLPHQRPFEAGLNINNRGAAYLGRTQIQVQAVANSFLRQGDQTTLTVAMPTEIERFQYVSLSHSEPIGATGATLSLSAGYLKTRPDVGVIDLSGTAKTASAQLVWPLLRGYSQNIYLIGGADGVESDNALFGRRLSSEKTRAVRLGTAYNRISARRVITLNATVSHGVDGLGARMALPGYAEPDFLKLNAQAGFNQALGRSWAVRLAAGGQYGADNLPASEQFSIGGNQFGRAFAASEAIGDSGYGASAELAYRPTKPLPKILAGSEVYVFADAAEAVSRPRAGAPEIRMNLASAGGGVRMALAGKVVVEIEAAKAIDEARNVRSGYDRPWGLMVNLRSTF